MSDPDEILWQDAPDSTPQTGWVEVVTPLGGSVHVRVDSVAWDLCTDWQCLNSGRGALCPTDPLEWFGEEGLKSAPSGVAAELLAAGGRMDDFTRLVADSQEAREHVLRIPDHVFGAEPEEWLLLGKCLDIVRVFLAREAARAAVAIAG